jgi:acyl-[acyl carrier protein]--UDP-N-acetylglucosamine O-acyltransferase
MSQHLESKKEEILKMVRELSPQEQVDLVNIVYETIYSEQRTIQQRSEMAYKQAEDIMSRFRYKITLK